MAAMGVSAVLCTLSDKRLKQIELDPETLAEVLEARHEMDIPGLLDIEKTWDALDILISDRGQDPVLGDAFIGRSGRKLRNSAAYSSARLLKPARVSEVADALAKLPPDVVRAKYRSLEGKEVHGSFDAKTLEHALEAVKVLYAKAASTGHSMLVILV